MSGRIKHSVERKAFEEALSLGIEKAGICSKCDHYADEWQKTADLLWKESHPMIVQR